MHVFRIELTINIGELARALEQSLDLDMLVNASAEQYAQQARAALQAAIKNCERVAAVVAEPK